MPGRIEPPSGAVNRYKYGFNGKENDKETVGTGEGTQDYGFRIYNPSLGKFLSVDLLTKTFPAWSPYPFAMNRPVEGIDLDGLEFLNNTKALISFSYGYGGVVFKIENFNDNQKATWTGITEDKRNWNGGIGASPLLSSVSIYKHQDQQKSLDNATDAETSYKESQTNFQPNPQNSAYAPLKIRDRWKANSLPLYRNSGAVNTGKIANGVSILSSAVDLYKYTSDVNDNLNWAEVIQTSWSQSTFAQRTLEVVQDAIDKGFIKQEHQTDENIYAIMNYVLLGDEYGNKIAEEIGKNIIKIYGVPVQPTDVHVTTPGPSAAPTGGTTANPDESKEAD